MFILTSWMTTSPRLNTLLMESFSSLCIDIHYPSWVSQGAMWNTVHQSGVILHFKDPDSRDELCNLTDTKNQPTNWAPLKVLFTFTDPVSDSTLDIANLMLHQWNGLIPQLVLLSPMMLNFSWAQQMMPMPRMVQWWYSYTGQTSWYDCLSKKRKLWKCRQSAWSKAPLPLRGSEGFCQRMILLVFSLKFKMGNYHQRLMAAWMP